MVAFVTTSSKYCPAGTTMSYVSISPAVTPAGILTFVEVVTVEVEDIPVASVAAADDVGEYVTGILRRML